MPTQTGSPYSCKSQNAKRQNRSCNQEGDKELARYGIHIFADKGVISPTLLANARRDKPGAAEALTAAFLAAEAACQAFIIRAASGSYDGGSPITGKAGGRDTEKVINTKHGIAGNDPEYVGNEDFWVNLKAGAKNYDYFGVTSSRAWGRQNQALTLDYKPAVTDTPTDEIGTDFTVTYNYPKPPISYPIIYELLNTPPFLPFTGFTSQATNAATLVSTTDLERITVAEGDLLSYKGVFTGAVDYGVRAESGGILPAGLAIAEDTGILSWTPAAGDEGTYTVFVKGENACGVLGEIEVEIIVTT